MTPAPDTSPEAVEHLVRYLTFNGLHEQSALVRALSGELARARECRRWNVDDLGDGRLSICRGDHDKGEKCEYVTYVPERSHG